MKATKTTTPLRDRCLSHCATLGIPLEGASLDELLSRAEKESLSHLHFLDLLLGAQADARRERAVARRIREARFADTKTLEGFDWRFNPKAFDRVQIEELATGDFIRRRNNLIMVGWSGIGKSHIIQALGQKVCVQGYRVLYRPSAELLADLTASLADKTLPARLRYYTRPDFLIVDEFGFDRIERTECARAAHVLYKIHRLTQPEALYRGGDQRGLRQMGRVSGRWPAGDGPPRPPGRKSNHPQGQRQDLSHPPGQKRRKPHLRKEAALNFPFSAPTEAQSVTPHLAPFQPPNWYPFSPAQTAADHSMWANRGTPGSSTGVTHGANKSRAFLNRN